ncbi:COR domain-containing protein [Pelomonas sp. APW6]|uniref:COR domain-containing protein n=1 Tax=Roseateles subflavus TaxID=3053353 RepID=A0ABT7LE79_9BURK|nr:leucine-rich repeat domain-containing protein [Pelomonas sp. APW6]MDL5031157.1 COR domain-containing protein [Pelomonas sp. APW6]
MPRHELAHAIAEERIRQALDTGATKLSLGALRIDRLPESFQQLAPQLLELDLSHCEVLLELPRLDEFHALQQLRLQSCSRLGKFDALAGIPALEGLDLQGCENLKDLSALANLKTLRQLNLSNCLGVQDLAALACLPRLEELAATQSAAFRDLSFFADLSALQTLQLSARARELDLSALARLPQLRTFVLGGSVSCISHLSCIDFPQLQELDLSWCMSLEGLGALTRMPQLQELDLSGCQKIRDLSALAELRQLSSLQLGECEGLQDLTALAGLAQLRSLALQRCKGIRDLGPLAQLTQLQSLTVNRCPSIRDLSPIAGLDQLQALHLCGSALLRDVQTLAKLPQLTSLTLQNFDELEDLSALTPLKQLQGLNIRGFESLRDVSVLRLFTALHSLQLTWCPRLKDLSALAALTQLRSLDLSGCTSLLDLSPLTQATELQSLDLGWNGTLRDLTALAGLTRLQQLDLTGCTAVQDLSALAGMTQLEALELRNCRQLSDIASLAGLEQLTELNLSGCKAIEDLSALSQLSRLRMLVLRDCPAIRHLAPLAGLHSLSTLALAQCAAVQDVGALSQLTQLEFLDLTNCAALQDLTPLTTLQNLRALHLLGTPTAGLLASTCWTFWPQLSTLVASTLQGLPGDLLSSEAHDSLLERMMGWMDDLAEHGSIPIDEVKLFVLGNGRIGKTQVSRRLCGQPFDPEVPSTHGVVLQRFELPISAGRPQQTVQLWDFGGQDLFLGTHSLFLDARAMYLLLWHPALENEKEVWDGGLCLPSHRLSYWLDYVQSMAGPEAPTIVAQAQCDEESAVVEAPIPPEHGFRWLRRSSCSARSEDGTERLVLDLRSAAKLLAERYGEELIPRNWVALGKVLREHARTRKVMSLADYQALCAAHGVRAPTTLLTYLHQSGQVFWREAVFDSALILDQAWALEGVYALLHRDKVLPVLRRQGGRFTPELLESLLWEGHFNQAEQAHFLSLMESCRVCFSLSDGEYIAPDCLQERAAVAAAEDSVWRGARPDAELHLIYPFLHAGLQRTLLAEIGGMAGMNAVYWRHGCCLFDAKAQALLRMDCEPAAAGVRHGRVVLQAAGPQAGDYLRQLVSHLLDRVRIGRPPELAWISGEPQARPPLDEERNSKDPMDKPTTNTPVVMPAALPPGTTATRNKPVVYVSYAWGGDSDATVDGLQKALAPWVEVHRDKEVMRTGDSIRRFEEEIGRGLCVLVVLSARYMRSVDCMRELGFVWERAQRDPAQFADRVVPVVLEDAGIGKLADRLRHVQHWKATLAELKALVAEIGPVECGQTTTQQLQDIGTFTVHLADALNTLADKVMPRGKATLEASNYSPVVDLVKRRHQLG